MQAANNTKQTNTNKQTTQNKQTNKQPQYKQTNKQTTQTTNKQTTALMSSDYNQLEEDHRLALRLQQAELGFAQQAQQQSQQQQQSQSSTQPYNYNSGPNEYQYPYQYTGGGGDGDGHEFSAEERASLLENLRPGLRRGHADENRMVHRNIVDNLEDARAQSGRLLCCKLCFALMEVIFE